MKKTLLAIFIFTALLAPAIVKATTWTMADTVIATVDSFKSVYDAVVVTGSGNVLLNWHVTASTFPADWRIEAALGICDNKECYNNTSGTYVWDSATNFGTTFTSNAYTSGEGDFHLQLNLTNASCGTHTITVYLTDGALNYKTVTFIITKPCPSSVQPVSNAESNVVLYPNPAANELNVVYDAGADIKNIAVYNIIGKVMTVYKVTANNSANLDINNLPPGIYFMRMINSHGAMVTTRKFTKQ